MMTAVEISNPGPSSVLRPVRRAVPVPGPGEVLIRVRASGVNRADVMQRHGQYPPPPGVSDIPGLEVAGTVVATGPGVSELSIGADVCALVAGGGYAEYCVAPVPQCLHIPQGLDFSSAAAIPETFFTVWTNVFDLGHLNVGDTLLVHGGSSGVGTTAIMLGNAFGARVFTTTGSATKCTACEQLGAERAINYRTENFSEVIKILTQGKGVNVILDIVGGTYLRPNLQSLATDGRLVIIGLQGGVKAEINLTDVIRRRLVLTGSTLRARSVEEKGTIAEALKLRVWPLIVAGTVCPVVHKTIPLKEAEAAHAIMEASTHIGKLVLVTEK